MDKDGKQKTVGKLLKIQLNTEAENGNCLTKQEKE